LREGLVVAECPVGIDVRAHEAAPSHVLACRVVIVVWGVRFSYGGLER